MCDIHKLLTTNEIIKKCIDNNDEILKLVLLITQKTKPHYILPFYNMENNQKKVGYMALVELTYHFVKLNNNYVIDDVYRMIDKYNYCINNIPNYYNDHIEECLTDLINYSCKCKPHYLVTKNIDRYISPNRKDIFIRKNNIDNFEYSGSKYKQLLDCFVMEQSITTKIHQYIIDTFKIDMSIVNLKDYNTEFLLEYPYLINENMVDYICDEFLTINFGDNIDIHEAIHNRIIILKNARCRKIPKCIYENIPYKLVNGDVLDYDKILSEFRTIDTFSKKIMNNRYPIAKKILCNINFDLIEDPQFHIYTMLTNFIKSFNGINKKIIDIFPPMNENIVFDKNNLGFVCNGDNYKFPTSMLPLLIDTLNKINFVLCDDIHLKIHNVITELQDNIEQVNGYITNVNLSDIYDYLGEKAKTIIFRLSMGVKNVYLDENNKAIDNTKFYKLKSDAHIPIVKRIIIDISICMLCDAKKHKPPKISFSGINKFISNSNNKFHVCNKMCKYVMLNNSHIQLTIDNNMVYKYDYNKNFWNLRHFKFKTLFLWKNWMNSNFVYLDMDIMGNILYGYMNLVL